MFSNFINAFFTMRDFNMVQNTCLRGITGRLFAVIFFSLLAALFLGSLTAFAADPVLDVRAFPLADKALPVSPGADVTYFYQIENTGATPVSEINITDDKCTEVTYDAVNQDANVDHKLDKGETWSYYCKIKAGSTTTSTVKVSGHVDGAPVSAVTTTTLRVPAGGGASGGVGGTGTVGADGGIVFYDPADGSGAGGNIVPNGMPNTGNGGANKAKAKSAKVTEKAVKTTKKLEIPALKVDAKIEDVGLTKTGSMNVPANDDNVGLYKHGAKPGDKGNAVIAGHLDTYTSSNGVFKNLDKLKTGDDIFVTDSGNTTHFRVSKSEVYDSESAPLQAIFGSSDKVRLNLITCTGKWDNRLHQYTHRLVIYTDLVQ